MGEHGLKRKRIEGYDGRQKIPADNWLRRGPSGLSRAIHIENYERVEVFTLHGGTTLRFLHFSANRQQSFPFEHI